MLRGCVFPVAAVTLWAGAAAVRGQTSPEKTVAGLRVPEGWEVTLYASEPLITNPTAIDIDAQGRVWVCEGQWYRARAKTPPADCVKVLEDADGDGRADRASVFADGLLVPMSVAVAGTRVYVGESPNLWVYEDRDGDLKADAGSRRALLTGFGGHNSDHGLHGLVIGPDHWLYMTHGDPGFDVTGPDGSRARYRWGAMLRCELDGKRLEALAVNFRNPYELAVDSFGNVWCSDNDSDGDKAVRICWILEGGNYGWYGTPMPFRSPDGVYDPLNEWRTPIPGHVPAALITGFGSPSGMTFYEHDLFGGTYQNRLLHADPGPREVRAYERRPSGAGFVARQENILTGDDAYFRAVDVCVAPDGSIYVADWYDEGVGGHAYNNPGQGRIYRLAPRGVRARHMARPGPCANLPDALEALASPNLATQFLAREFLLGHAGEGRDALTKLAGSGPPNLAARALWLLDRMSDEGAIDAALIDQRPAFRALAVRMLRRREPLPLDRILPRAHDPDVQVRREVLLALRRVNGDPKEGGAEHQDAALTALLDLIRAWDGQDRFYLEAIGVAAGGRGPQVFEVLGLNDAQKLDRRAIKLLQILHPHDEVALLTRRLDDAGISAELAEDVIDALGWMTESEAMTAVAKATGRADLPPTARRLALQRIRGRIASDYKKLADSPELQDGLRAALSEPPLQIDALGLAGEACVTQLDEVVAGILRGASGATLKLAAVTSLGKLNTPTARRALLREIPLAAADLQRDIVRTLATMRAFDELQLLLTSAGLSPELPSAAVAAAGKLADGCLFLLTLIDDGKLAAPLRDQAIRLGSRHANVNVRQLYAKYVPAASQPATIAQLDPKRVLALKGDANRGRELFVHSAVRCDTCHRVGADGADVGPDLTLIGRKYAPAAMLEQITRPAAAVSPEFVPHVVESESQGYLMGFLLGRTEAEITLKTQDGQRITLPASDVRAVQKQEGTIMPDLLLESFTEQDVADLLAYLSSLKVLPQPIREWQVAGPFPAREFHLGFETAYGPEEKLDPAARYALPEGGEATWRPYKPPFAGDQYVVELEKLTSAGRKPAVTYLYARLDSPRSQGASISLQSDAAVKIFLNGKAVFSRHRHPVRAASIPIRLASGPNDLLLKLEHQGGEGRMTVLVASSAPLEAGK